MNKVNKYLKKIKNKALQFYYSFDKSQECKLCGWSGHEFRKKYYPEKPAPDQICPQCGSCPRHRLAYYLLFGKLGSDHATLHIAPEKMMDQWLQSISQDYLSIDLSNPAMKKMDLTKLELNESSYSLIWCSHVLEHIIEDSKAMSEIYRVLKFGGKAIIQVPIYGASTYEDFSITSPEERLKHFKQKDHVRLYGLDIVERLEKAGFDVEVLDTSGIPSDTMNRYMLDYPSTREIFVCTKVMSKQ